MTAINFIIVASMFEGLDIRRCGYSLAVLTGTIQEMQQTCDQLDQTIKWSMLIQISCDNPKRLKDTIFVRLNRKLRPILRMYPRAMIPITYSPQLITYFDNEYLDLAGLIRVIIDHDPTIQLVPSSDQEQKAPYILSIK